MNFLNLSLPSETVQRFGNEDFLELEMGTACENEGHSVYESFVLDMNGLEFFLVDVEF